MAKRILVVEDDKRVAMVLEASFVPEGHEVDTSICHEGQPRKVVSELKISLEGRTIGKPDFAVVDGLGGVYKDVEKILEKYDIPYAVFTGTPEILNEVRNRGLPAFIKPEGRKALIDYVNSL